MERSTKASRRWLAPLLTVGRLSLCSLLVACLTGCTRPEINEDRLKSDLLGRTMGSIVEGGWRFSSLSEFRDLWIVERRSENNIIELDIGMALQDQQSERIYAAGATVVYRDGENGWSLVSVSEQFLTRWGTYVRLEPTDASEDQEPTEVIARISSHLDERTTLSYAIYPWDMPYRDHVIYVVETPYSSTMNWQAFASELGLRLAPIYRFQGPIGFPMSDGGIKLLVPAFEGVTESSIRNTNASVRPYVQSVEADGGGFYLIWYPGVEQGSQDVVDSVEDALGVSFDYGVVRGSVLKY